MIIADNILQKANKEIKKLNAEKDKWYREFHLMKIYAAHLKEELHNCTCQIDSNITSITLTQCDGKRKKAMEKYTEKLKKENLKYAKQKQGQRQPPREISSKSSKGSRDQSSSSICK